MEFVNTDTQVKVNASFFYFIEKKLCKEQIVLGKARIKGTLENSLSSKMILDDLDFIKDRKKIDTTYGYIVNSKISRGRTGCIR